MRFKSVPGSVTAPEGFLAAGVFCDIKRLGTGKGSNKGQKLDLALLVSQVPATSAGMFTTNQVCAPPVRLCIERVKGGVAQAIVANSGNANACTGKPGLQDARAMAAAVANELRLPAEHVLVGSTGRIGVRMPMANVKRGICLAAARLGAQPEHAAQAAEAIMTSDTRRKEVAIEFALSGRRVRIGGICKGAGMIQPGMSATGQRPGAAPAGLSRTGLHATLLCFITTDAAIAPGPLQAALQEAVAQSFNRITVDGDMSTNDTVLVLANGLAGNPPITVAGTDSPGRARSLRKEHAAGWRQQLQDFATFQAALTHVCLELAKMNVRDGEGASRFVTVRVSGAKSFSDADAAARAVANSALVKASWHGGDPNWGRIIDALGYSPALVVEEKVDIGYSAPGSRRILYAFKRGQPAKASFKRLCAAVAPRDLDLHLNLNLGQASAVIYAADLTEDYVDFNKGDLSDPASLGG